MRLARLITGERAREEERESSYRISLDLKSIWVSVKKTALNIREPSSCCDRSVLVTTKGDISRRSLQKLHSFC